MEKHKGSEDEGKKQGPLYESGQHLTVEVFRRLA